MIRTQKMHTTASSAGEVLQWIQHPAEIQQTTLVLNNLTLEDTMSNEDLLLLLDELSSPKSTVAKLCISMKINTLVVAEKVAKLISTATALVKLVLFFDGDPACSVLVAHSLLRNKTLRELIFNVNTRETYDIVRPVLVDVSVATNMRCAIALLGTLIHHEAGDVLASRQLRVQLFEQSLKARHVQIGKSQYPIGVHSGRVIAEFLQKSRRLRSLIFLNQNLTKDACIEIAKGVACAQQLVYLKLNLSTLVVQLDLGEINRAFEEAFVINWRLPRCSQWYICHSEFNEFARFSLDHPLPLGPPGKQ